MFLLLCLFCSITIIGIGLVLRKRRGKAQQSMNEDLEKFYELFAEPIAAQLKQLTQAARVTLSKHRSIVQERETVTELYEEGILGEESYQQVQVMEEDLVLEKAMIENEAEGLKNGGAEQVFSEAGRLGGVENKKKKKVFDEALFLKKRDNLLKDLQDRVSAHN